MADLPADLIGPAGVARVEAIPDTTLRERVAAGLGACAAALRVVDDLDLEQYEMADVGLPDLSVWNAAAPEVRNVLLVVHDTIEELADEFPPAHRTASARPAVGDDDDFVEVMFGGDDPVDESEPVRDNVSVEIDEIVGHASDTRVGETVATLTGMLKHELESFGRRLRSPRVVADRWYLLGELQEFRNKCTKCLEAIAATMLTVFGGAELDQVLPRYATEARRGADLRATVIDLGFDVRAFKAKLEGADSATAQRVRIAIGDRLRRFCESPPYRTMRALDKRGLIAFRLRLGSWTPVDSSIAELREAVEGFDKLLELMRGINRRAELVHEDKTHLEAARDQLARGHQGVAVDHLARVYGRHSELDDWLRALKYGGNPPAAALPLLVDAALANLTGFG